MNHDALELAAERAGEDGLLHAVDGGQRFLRRLPGALLLIEQAIKNADDFLLLGERGERKIMLFDDGLRNIGLRPALSATDK